MNIHFEYGTVSKNIEIVDAVVRTVEEQDEFDEFPVERVKLQARLKNVGGHCLDDVKCDLSYYDAEGAFLGLDMTDSLELDAIDPDEIIPVDLEIVMPDEIDRCVLNAHSRLLRAEPSSASRPAIDSSKTL